MNLFGGREGRGGEVRGGEGRIYVAHASRAVVTC